MFCPSMGPVLSELCWTQEFGPIFVVRALKRVAVSPAIMCYSFSKSFFIQVPNFLCSNNSRTGCISACSSLTLSFVAYYSLYCTIMLLNHRMGFLDSPALFSFIDLQYTNVVPSIDPHYLVLRVWFLNIFFSPFVFGSE